MKRIHIAIAVVATAALLSGCTAAASTTAATATTTAPQAASSKQPGCTTAVAAVQQVASEAGIDLLTGATDGRTVSGDDAIRWAGQLGQAAKAAAQGQLAADLVRAQAAATMLGLDVAAGKSLDADAKSLTAALQAVTYDC
jgi:uncharacterized protein YceK